MSDSTVNNKVVLITGAGKRIGATIARQCHKLGMYVAVHYRNSAKEANNLCQQLNQQRKNSAITLQADLNKLIDFDTLISVIINRWGKLDVLINNASSFYATPFEKTSTIEWEDLMTSNLKSPFFLSQSAAPYLKEQEGCIINLVDIQAQRPLKNYSIYCIAKAGLVMLTKSLAQELAPSIRVNAVAPGIILWPDNTTELDAQRKKQIVSRNLLKRAGRPQDIANIVSFLINEANYITGQVIAVDGGRSLNA